MRWRVVSEATGEEIGLSKDTESFVITQNGVLGIVDKLKGYVAECSIEGGYVLEFAFFKDEAGQWVYENCVFSIA